MAEPELKKRKVHQPSPLSRGWVFTIFQLPGNLPIPPLLTDCPLIWPENITWGICSQEQCPSTQKLHLQGAIWYQNRVRLQTLQKTFGDKAHFEVMRGSPQQSETYCSKDNTHIAGPWRFGTIPVGRGKRTDWDDAKEQLTSGHTVSEVVVAMPHLAPCFKGLEFLSQALRPPVPLERDIQVFYLWGDSGVGKSHRVHHRYPDAYVIKGVFHPGKSFDDYNGESVLFLDEFHSAHYPIEDINAILDKWPYRMQCRYANKVARWTTVVLCSNRSPDMCYPDQPTFIRQCFLRRISRSWRIDSILTEVDFELSHDMSDLSPVNSSDSNSYINID